jgi:hypothetical protein
MPNELHTTAGAYELPEGMAASTMEDLLAAAGQGWTIARVIGLWSAERRGPGTVRRYLVARTAGALVGKITAADAADLGWPHAGPVCLADWATCATVPAGYVTTVAAACHHRSCEQILTERYAP